jgi:hypothetical protein
MCPQRHQHATQHTGAVSATQCECGGGHEIPQRALPGDNCTQCAAGFEKPLPGTQPCTPCGLGTYAPSPAHATCLLCPPRSYQNAAQQTTCVSCPASFHGSVPGAKSMHECVCGPGHTTTTLVLHSHTTPLLCQEYACVSVGPKPGE